jgi:Tol biopolymer transport system component
MTALTLSLTAWSLGCSDPSKERSAAPIIDEARRLAQVDLVGSISSDGRFLTFFQLGTFDELFVRDLVTRDDRLLSARPGEVGYYGAPISPRGNEVAYSWSLRYPECEIRVVGLDGTGLRVVYREDGVCARPEAWSADGREILIQRLSRPAQETSMALVTVGTGSLREIRPAALLHDQTTLRGTARLSPDDRWIAFDSPTGGSSANTDVFVVSVDGQIEIPAVAHAANDRLLDWTPDGQHILFASDRNGSWDLWAVSIQGGRPTGPPRRIRQDVGPVLRSAGVTHDGSLHYVLSGWENDLYVAALETSGTVEHTVTVATKLAPNSIAQWSPDGQYLVYASGGGSPDDPLVLVVRNTDTAVESRHPLRARAFHSFRPSWSPDGRAVLFQGRSDEHRGSRLDSQGLYRIDIETGETTPLVQIDVLCPPGCVEWGIWSPSGDAIFVRWGNPKRVVARELQRGRERELYRNAASGGEEISLLAVSPDGKWLAIAWGDHNVGERAGVKVVSTSGEGVRDLVSLPGLADYWMPLFAMAWTPDSRHLIYAATRRGDKRVELKRVSVDGGAPEDLGLVLEGGWSFGLSVHPDGRQIALTAGSLPGEEAWVLRGVPQAIGDPRQKDIRP